MKKSRSIITLMVVLYATIGMQACQKENKMRGNPPQLKYFSAVRSIVQHHCTITCHSPSQGFYDGLPVVLETDSAIADHASGIKSAVFDSVTATNKRMPPAGELSGEEKDIILRWCTKGGHLYD